MPRKQSQKLCIDDLRHNEYYGMQDIYDELYENSRQGHPSTDLMHIVLKRENILLAYRNIKTNGGSKTPGTDGMNIDDIAKCTQEEVVEKIRYIVQGSKHGYRPKPVRRKEIPKPNGSIRPLGIPCIWDRLVQQCIKQVLEPICEAKFSDNSYGFRPNRSVENAIARTYRLMQMSNLHYVIEFDIKGFFDNVDHSKLIKQMWALGIHDKHLLWVIKQILKAKIRMPDGSLVTPKKGTPQGGIISPLLANIVLNELDRWVESQWQSNPIIYNYKEKITRNGTRNNGHAYRGMRDTNLKEMWIVRYADDFRIFCKTKTAAAKTKLAVTMWLKERLRLDISEEKTRIVNVKRRYSEFLGFKIKVYPRGSKYVVKSHMADKQIKLKTAKLKKQAIKIGEHPGSTEEAKATVVYNAIILGFHNYYRIATEVCRDFNKINRQVMIVLKNRLNTESGNRLVKKGRRLTQLEQQRYGKSKVLRYVAGTDEPIYPASYVQFKNPMAYNRRACCYTTEGRAIIHEQLGVNTAIMLNMMRQSLFNHSVEFADNRISLFAAQWGKCFVTGIAFETVEEIHCHHKKPKAKGGTDKYDNLVLILDTVHRLVHATDPEIIQKYMNILKLKKGQMRKLNELRVLAGNDEIAQ